MPVCILYYAQSIQTWVWATQWSNYSLLFYLALVPCIAHLHGFYTSHVHVTSLSASWSCLTLPWVSLSLAHLFFSRDCIDLILAQFFGSGDQWKESNTKCTCMMSAWYATMLSPNRFGKHNLYLPTQSLILTHILQTDMKLPQNELLSQRVDLTLEE